MKYPVYSIRDVKAGFGQPQLSLNEATMIRQFGYQINTAESILKYAPADYALYRIGEFDTDSGSFKSIIPEFVINGTDVYGVNGND